MQLQVVDLKNLVYLARKGIVAIGEGIKPEEAAAAWNAIGNAEGFLENFNKMIAQQASKTPEVVTTGNEDGTTSDLHIVNLNEDGSVNKDESPKVENLES